MHRNPQLGHEQPLFDNQSPPQGSLLSFNLLSRSDADNAHQPSQPVENLNWGFVEARVSITPELLPPELAKYKHILKILTPTSKGELSIANAGLVRRIETSQSSGELYQLVTNVELYAAEAEKALLSLPQLQSARWNHDMTGESIRHNPVAQSTLADYLLAVDWINAGKWQPKTRNGYETKALGRARLERIGELQTFSNEALGRLSSLVIDKQEYRASFWRHQLDELSRIIQADTDRMPPGTDRDYIKFIQAKMNELNEAIEAEYRRQVQEDYDSWQPDGEETDTYEPERTA